jgi:hypothetical protein
LSLAATERVGGPVKRHIIRADAIEKSESALDLGHDGFCHRSLVVGKLQFAKKLDGLGYRERRDFVDSEAA